MAPQDSASKALEMWESVEGDDLEELHAGSSCLLEEALSQCINFGQRKEGFVVGRGTCDAPKLTAAWSRPAVRERHHGQRFKQYCVHVAYDARSRTQSWPSRTPSPLRSGRCSQQGNFAGILRPPSRSAGHHFPILRDACREAHAAKGTQPWCSRKVASTTEESTKHIRGSEPTPCIASNPRPHLFDRRAESLQSPQPNDQTHVQAKRSNSPPTRKDSSSVSGTSASPNQFDEKNTASSRKSSSSPTPRKKKQSTRNPSPPRPFVPQRSSVPADATSSKVGEPTQMHEDNTELQAFPLLRDSGKMPGQESSILKALRKLKFQDNKQDRLARVSVCRRQKLQEPSRVNRDKIMRRESIEWAQESFSRYYPSRPTPSKFSSELVTEALADFGVKAGTRPEKLVVKEYFAQKEGIDMHFGEFCKIVERFVPSFALLAHPVCFKPGWS